MKILGIESSCDETAAAVIEAKGDKIKVVSNVVSSQINIHKKYGGVIPELAARNHIKNILPVIRAALSPRPLSRLAGEGKRAPVSGVRAIAVTTGPGLISSLLIGIETAKALSYAWQKPLISVNHLAGHIYGNFITNKNIKFPALALIVSGGHTELIFMRGHYQFKLLGQTRDDAAGEAFDKAAKILGLGYPGGPAVAQEAMKIINHKSKIINLKLPRPMINDDNFDFSFSGLKTALLYQTQKDSEWRKKIPSYCAEFQQAIIDVLISKTVKAAKKHQVKSIMLAGGVAANLELRRQLSQAVAQKLPGINFHLPDLKYTTDNAAMIAAAGYFYIKTLKRKNIKTKLVKVDCNKKL
ncbi:tRNA (adenosine(37)-N6)-threonylcarbamoyltransferase complex transferase subunit TsaD [Candidatus Falkowbacteria bacterium CG10_big_fil_rev_8_21_14_0_10_43_11]|uniref:tRNA N6-adenosine threonylcarbamoyltransferase n=1 Tax=Candidatus Falkowbacteria bacterium CG10_big_fil_rev_8_21_14_0_10_43_11 TaxID=1974568 RepID=A0A2M6WN27_9BACT|nr:MAG: tRNA (adenosine(37)-N6)-threonylcarbamoyltransferase complex transferase subunit TsaD [Candidatus Falkowbacteria bacterium CG10_big_fil_rev_8_21_14_0_10_43_11]